MNKWQETNTRGFRITFNDGTITTMQGPELAPENLSFDKWPYKLKTIVNVEEYTYEDTIKWSIEANHKQIAICLKQIKALEAQLETA